MRTSQAEINLSIDTFSYTILRQITLKRFEEFSL
jgi:hypothetical protein